MYCNKCGKKIKDDANFCNNCGSPVTNKIDDKSDYNENSSSVNDEDLIKAYVGNNYNAIKNTKFSIPTFFLGTYYFLYRKMWLYVILAIIISIASTIIAIVTDLWYISFATSLYMIFMSIKFSEVYLHTVRKRVENIKMNNQDKTGKELLDICKSKGGVSVLAVVITTIFILPIVLFVTFFIIFYGMFEGIGEDFFNDNNSIENKSELKYDLPDIYKKNDNSYNSDTYQSYHYTDANNSCSISITNYATYSNKSTEEHLKDNVVSSMNEDVSEIKNSTINNYKWSFVEINSKVKKEYKYASVYNGKLYIVSYVINNDNNKLCSNGYNTFISSLKFNSDKSGVDKNTV